MVIFEILDGIYQGGKLDIEEESKKGVIPAGILSILNLRLFPDNFPDNSLKAYLWMPIYDEPPFPDISWMNLAVDFVYSCKGSNWPILIHCAEGISRSAMVMIGYCMKYECMSYNQALDFVSSKNPNINPNSAFKEGLKFYR